MRQQDEEDGCRPSTSKLKLREGWSLIGKCQRPGGPSWGRRRYGFWVPTRGLPLRGPFPGAKVIAAKNMNAGIVAVLKESLMEFAQR